MCMLTLDINDHYAAYLCVVNLHKTLQTGNLDMQKIKITQTEQRNGGMDQKIKCRFVASNNATIGIQNCNKTFAPSGIPSDEIAYVSGMNAKKIYYINLKTKESKILKLTEATQTTPADLTFCAVPTNATFVSPTSANTAVFRKELCLPSPTGLQVDNKGNLIIADRTSNEIYAFTPSGELIRKFAHTKEEDGCLGPLGMSLDPEHPHLLVCSNKNKKVIEFSLV